MAYHGYVYGFKLQAKNFRELLEGFMSHVTVKHFGTSFDATLIKGF